MSARAFPFIPAEVEAFARSMGLHGERLEAIHDYTHADGSPWWWIARWKNTTTGKKRPLPFHSTPEGFARKMPEIAHGKRPLYRLHKLEQYPADLVYLAEGCNCADLLESLGFLGTTWPNGSQSVLASDWLPLAGRRVIAQPDNDAPGFEAMRQAKTILQGMGARVLTVDVVALGLPPKGDIVDWLRLFVERHGAKDLSEIPNGHALARQEIENFPLMEWKVAA